MTSIYSNRINPTTKYRVRVRVRVRVRLTVRLTVRVRVRAVGLRKVRAKG